MHKIRAVLKMILFFGSLEALKPWIPPLKMRAKWGQNEGKIIILDFSLLTSLRIHCLEDPSRCLPSSGELAQPGLLCHPGLWLNAVPGVRQVGRNRGIAGWAEHPWHGWAKRFYGDGQMVYLWAAIDITRSTSINQCQAALSIIHYCSTIMNPVVFINQYRPTAKHLQRKEKLSETAQVAVQSLPFPNPAQTESNASDFQQTRRGSPRVAATSPGDFSWAHRLQNITIFDDGRNIVKPEKRLEI